MKSVEIARRIFALVLAVVPTALAATHYVDSACSLNGNGSTATCGATGPWSSMGNINCASLAAGDHVQLRGGTYSGVWQPTTACSGAATNPIVIENSGFRTRMARVFSHRIPENLRG